MQNEMARLHQIAQNVLNLQRTQTLTPVIAKNRPEGHEQNAMEGGLFTFLFFFTFYFLLNNFRISR